MAQPSPTLLAAVIHLQAAAHGRIEGSTGRAVHGFWFRHWQQVNPALADRLHHNSSVQPFTLSPLLGLPRASRGVTAVAAGQSAWFRVAALSDDIAGPLLEQWLPGLPEQIELADLPWTVQGFVADEGHGWAGQKDYAALLTGHFNAAPQPRRWTLSFRTPTAFHAGQDAHLPFPLPDSLVGSWLRRWQAFAPHKLDDDLRQRVRDNLYISAYDLQTVPVRHGRRVTIGCVGRLTLRAGKLSVEDRAVISLLADYAFFAGSGHRTTQGMGLTRPLSNSQTGQPKP